jgi:branched-chain amino acid aminotransferase
MQVELFTHRAEDGTRNAGILIWIDGKLLPREKAMVSVYDSGFMLGNGVWEGLRLYDGRSAFLDDHLDRLFEAEGHRSRSGPEPPWDHRSPRGDAGRQRHDHRRPRAPHVTRGVKTRPFQHPALSQRGPAMVIIMEHSRPRIPRPIRLATVPHLRGLPMTQDLKLNSHSTLNCILACIAAEKAGADEALMLDVHGFVNTTNACNFFIVRKGAVWTSTGAFGAQTPAGEIDGRTVGTGRRDLYKALVTA